MDSVILNQKLNPRDEFMINKILGLGVKVQNHVAYIKTTRAEISRETKVSTKTVTRKLQQFGDVSLISFEHKLGAKGGLVIKLNPDRFNFGELKSPLTNPTKKETSLINRLFPKYRRTKAIRRTKTEMKEYNALKRTFSNEVKKANELLISEYIDKKDLDWEFFESIPNTNHVYKVWLISRIYDAMVDSYEKFYTQAFSDPDNDGVIGYEKERHFKSYKSLNGAFVGSYNYRSFERLLSYSEEVGVEPAVIMAKVFERYRYTHITYSRPAKIPVPNQIIDKNGKRILSEAIANQKSAKRFYGTLSIDMNNSPELLSVYLAYRNFVKGTEYKTTNCYIYDTEGLSSSFHYYNQVMYNLGQLGATEYECRVVDFYLREQFKMHNSYNASTAIASEAANYAINKVIDYGIDSNNNDDIYGLARGLGYQLGKDSPNLEWYRNLLVYANKKEIAQEVNRIENMRLGHFYSLQEITEVLSKYKGLFPISPSGMLRFNLITTKF